MVLTTSAGGSSLPLMTTREFTATYQGQTAKRSSAKTYTHASVVRWSDGSVGIASFHISETAALKGVLTGQQKRNGAAVVAVVPVQAV